MDKIQSMCELIGIPQEGIDYLQQLQKKSGHTSDEISSAVLEVVNFAKECTAALKKTMAMIGEFARQMAEQIKVVEKKERSRQCNGQRRPFHSCPSNNFSRIRPTARSTL